MTTTNFEGIVIGSILYKETSKIVYLYTKYGKISVKALGSQNQKKGLLPFITTMNRVEAITTDSDFPTLKDYSLIDSYQCIKEDIKKTLWSLFIIEIISKLTPDSDHKRIYPLLIRCLELMNDNNPMLIGLMFQIKMTYAFGVSPELKKCVICQNSDVKYFSVEKAGALCMNHKTSNSYGNELLNDIKELYYFNIYDGDINSLVDIDLIKCFNIINNYYENYVQIYLKTLNSLII